MNAIFGICGKERDLVCWTVSSKDRSIGYCNVCFQSIAVPEGYLKSTAILCRQPLRNILKARCMLIVQLVCADQD